MTVIHPCAEEHPWALTDAPITLLAAMWEDAMRRESPDAAELLTAWHDKQPVPAPRAPVPVDAHL